MNFVNAELFVIDHFWAMMFKKSSTAKEGYANFTDFKSRMFQFFNSQSDPLLQIHEIEHIIQECLNYTIARNKRRDIVSKKTVRKVIYKGICQGVFINALLRQGDNTTREDAFVERSATTSQPKAVSERETETTERKDQKDGKRSPILPPTFNPVSPTATSVSAAKPRTETAKSQTCTKSGNKSVKSPKSQKIV